MQWRFIAGCLVIIGSQGIGIAYNRNLSCAIYHMEQQKRMLYYVIGEIRHLRKPLPELFEGMKKVVKEPYQSFLEDVICNLEENGPFAGSWRKELGKRIKSNCYPKEAMEYLDRFPDCFIYDGSQTQLEALDLFLQELEERLDMIKEEKQKQGRVVYLLSAVTGVFLLVLFL